LKSTHTPWASLFQRLRTFSDLEEMLDFLIEVLEEKNVCGDEKVCPIHAQIFSERDGVGLYHTIDDLKRGFNTIGGVIFDHVSVECAKEHILDKDILNAWTSKYEALRLQIIGLFGDMMAYSQLHRAKQETRELAHERYRDIIDKIHEFENKPPQDTGVSVDTYMADLRDKVGLLNRKSAEFERQVGPSTTPAEVSQPKPKTKKKR